MHRLCHFTSECHLPLILRDGYLRTTDSNVSSSRQHACPDVVWLLDEPELGRHLHGLRNRGAPSVDKTAVRFTLELPRSKVLRWTEFAMRHPYSPAMSDHLIGSAAGKAAVAKWWVTELPVPRARRRAVSACRTGEWWDLGTTEMEQLANEAPDYERVPLGGACSYRVQPGRPDPRR
jgi:hypothetical protein